MSKKNQLQMKHELAMYLSRRWQERCEYVKSVINDIKQNDRELSKICEQTKQKENEVQKCESEISRLRERTGELRNEMRELNGEKNRILQQYGLTNTEPIVSYKTSIKDDEKPCRNGQLNEHIAEFDRETERGVREILELE